MARLPYTVTHYVECGTCFEQIPVIIHILVDDAMRTERNQILVAAAFTDIDTSATNDHQFRHIIAEEF